MAKKRYSIWVREIDSDHDVELMQMDGDPADVVSALRQKTLTMKSLAGAKRKTQVAKYSWVRVVDNDRTRTG